MTPRDRELISRQGKDSAAGMTVNEEHDPAGPLCRLLTEVASFMRREALFLLSVHSFCWWVTDGWVVGTEANERIGIREKEETMKAWFIEPVTKKGQGL